MDLRALRRTCQQRLLSLGLPAPVDVDALFADLARRRGRTIEVVLVDTPVNGPCALWVSLRDLDYVVVERGSDPLHRDHMKLHEWAHIVSGHHGRTLTTDEFTRRLLPDLDPGMVEQILGRRTYTAEEEAEAEMMASLILTAADTAPVPRQPFDGQQGRHLDSLADTLERHDGAR